MLCSLTKNITGRRSSSSSRVERTLGSPQFTPPPMSAAVYVKPLFDEFGVNGQLIYWRGLASNLLRDHWSKRSPGISHLVPAMFIHKLMFFIIYNSCLLDMKSDHVSLFANHVYLTRGRIIRCIICSRCLTCVCFWFWWNMICCTSVTLVFQYISISH